jgi:hypothetical protein
VLSSDTVRNEPAASLESSQGASSGRGKSAVDRPVRQPGPAQPKLEDGNVPADPPHPQLTLPEQRPAATTERATGRASELSACANAMLALKRDYRRARQWAADPVDWPRAKAVGP